MKAISVRKALCMLALAVALAGCGSSSDETTSRVRVINALTGTASNVDVAVNGTTVATSLPFGAVTTTSTNVNAGTGVPISVLQTGTTTSLASASGNVTSNVDTVVLVTGTVGTTGATAPTAIVLSPIDLSGTPTSSQARIYLVNAAPGVTTTDFTYQIGGGTVISGGTLSNIAFEGLTPEQTTASITSGQTTVFTATVNGATVTSPAVTIQGGHTYVVVLTGIPGGTPAPAFQVLELV